jgi:hypothetical protein
VDPGWTEEDPDGPMADGCPQGPYSALAWSSDDGHGQVSQTAGKAERLASGGPWCR